jgi:hypothetical protein
MVSFADAQPSRNQALPDWTPFHLSSGPRATLKTNMIFVLDNYDSFTYNLVQYLGEEGAEVVVRRNDELTVEEVEALKPERILLSPGPSERGGYSGPPYPPHGRQGSHLRCLPGASGHWRGFRRQGGARQ